MLTDIEHIKSDLQFFAQGKTLDKFRIIRLSPALPEDNEEIYEIWLYFGENKFIIRSDTCLHVFMMNVYYKEGL